MLVGIRREDKNQWEARVPLTPENVRTLIELHRMKFVVQPSKIRAFPDASYAAAGAFVDEDLSDCDIIVAVKEIPVEFVAPNMTYLFFSHTIKGQPANMPLLRRLMELGCQVIDYERILDDDGRRLIFFGRHAGLAGMIESLWALGQRLQWEGISTPLSRIEQAHVYRDSDRAKRKIALIGEGISRDGLPPEITPLVCGFAGYGNVSQGAQEIFDRLPFKEIAPQDLHAFRPDEKEARHNFYKVVFKEEHMVAPNDPGAAFELQDYYRHPDKYHGTFGPYLEHLSMLINCVYWDARYPRLVSKAQLRELFAEGRRPRLRVLGDIACDINGSIECNVRTTQPSMPVYVYHPQRDETEDGVEGDGPVVLAVDNLPCELPVESSNAFGTTLTELLPGIVAADMSVDFEQCELPAPIRRAMIVYHGKLTPDYAGLERHLQR